MKKFILMLICAVLVFSSCTANFRAKNFGGTMTIRLENGQKLVEATWKDDNLWYLTEPMEDDYTPKTKTFQEDSSFGVIEGKVIFVETR